MFLDIISLRNVADAVRNPWKEINKIYSRTINASKLNRPFSSIERIDFETFAVDLILLPHQVVAFPLNLLKKMGFHDGQTSIIEELDGNALRYFFNI